MFEVSNACGCLWVEIFAADAGEFNDKCREVGTCLANVRCWLRVLVSPQSAGIAHDTFASCTSALSKLFRLLTCADARSWLSLLLLLLFVLLCLFCRSLRTPAPPLCQSCTQLAVLAARVAVAMMMTSATTTSCNVIFDSLMLHGVHGVQGLVSRGRLPAATGRWVCNSRCRVSLCLPGSHQQQRSVLQSVRQLQSGLHIVCAGPDLSLCAAVTTVVCFLNLCVGL